MLCYSLKTLDKLKETKEREKQEEEKHVAKATTSFVPTTNFLLTSNPFAKLKVPLLLPKV
jgi:hypothetical protein